MLAFETAKRLKHAGETVSFCGVLNLPPHIKWWMRQFDWAECLVHLAYFSGLVTEDAASEIAAEVRLLERSEAVAYLLAIANGDRLRELAMTDDALATWADVAYALQSRAGWFK